MDIRIVHLRNERMMEFFTYLKDHISDNGKDNSPLFLPISRNNLEIPIQQMESFKQGQSISIGKPGWRRIMVAENMKEEIIGHIDLKSHNHHYSAHRAILGMGVHRNYRQIGLGRLLIESIIKWARNETAIESIDLWVLSKNSAAIALYGKCGFEMIGEVKDMFRIDNASLSYIMMTKRIL